jgi:hypothetical protein
MSTTHRFIADPAAPSDVLDWFRSLNPGPLEVQGPRSVMFYFKEFGPLTRGPDDGIDGQKSPVVSVFLPRIRRGILWTVGEVHFHATPLRGLYPKLHKINAAFSKWLRGFPCVFARGGQDNEYSYYLEGSVRNYDPPIYAFESGLTAIRAERYFVSDDDTEGRLETLCKTLRLRGVACEAQQSHAGDVRNARA